MVTGSNIEHKCFDINGNGSCEICHNNLGGEEPSWCEHLITISVIEDPTCTKDGYNRIICDKCGIVIEESINPKFGHNPDRDGICINCGEIDPTVCKHEKSEVIKIEVGCLNAGGERIICHICGYEDFNETEKPLGHEFEKYTCIRCGACSHGGDYKSERVDPTCTKDGYESLRCGICGEEEYKVLSATGHVTNEDGYCLVCDVFVEEDDSSCEHEKSYNYREPTCTDEGMEGEICNKCGTLFWEETIPVMPHVFGENGVCTVCGFTEFPAVVNPGVKDDNYANAY